MAGEQTDSPPEHHHQWKNLLKTIALDEKLDRELGGQEADELDSSPLTDGQLQDIENLETREPRTLL